MRRLFSTFARGAPGLGLLLMRAAAAAALVAPAAHMLVGRPTYAGLPESVLGAVGGVLVAVGLWTPLSAGFATLLALAEAAAVPGRTCNGLMLAAMTMSLALLGPGGWSIDARLFGWKRIESAPRKTNGTPTD